MKDSKTISIKPKGDAENTWSRFLSVSATYDFWTAN